MHTGVNKLTDCAAFSFEMNGEAGIFDIRGLSYTVELPPSFQRHTRFLSHRMRMGQEYRCSVASIV